MPITKASGNSVTAAAKGDLVVGNATNDSGVLSVGANNTVLTADSSTATGLKWQAAAGGGANWSLLNAGGTNLSGSTTTVSGISGADKIMVLIEGASSASASSAMLFRLNTDSGSNYIFTYASLFIGNTYAASNFSRSYNFSGTSIPFADTANNANGDVTGYLLFSGCNAAGLKAFNYIGAANAGGASNQTQNYGGGLYAGTSTISSVSIISNTGNFDSGKIYVYTSA